eukprot:m.127752 g.127752  ORF g.127752 m.127752 type:complete len:405 (+) comp16715_c0_seq1:166-1380(+)
MAMFQKSLASALARVGSRSLVQPTRSVCHSCRSLRNAAPGLVSAENFGQLYPTVPGTRMNSLVKSKPAKGLWLQDSEIPIVLPGHILVNVKSASVCGTDLHIYNWDEWAQKIIPVPMTIGHEYVGVVAEIGEGVEGFEVGERVTGEGHVTCGICRSCRAGRRHHCRNTSSIGVNRPGAFADYMLLPAVNAFKLPDEIPDRIGAIMDPLGNAVHCALSYNMVGEDVLITGAGPIGVMAAAVCKQVGARHVVVTDINDYRLDLAKQCGADVTINVKGADSTELLKQTMADLGMTEGFDIGLEMSGQESALSNMIGVMNHGGHVAMLGIPSKPFTTEWDTIVWNSLTVKGVYGREMFETWYKMRNMLQAGLIEAISPVITHKVGVRESDKAFDIMSEGNCGKVVIEF